MLAYHLNPNGVTVANKLLTRSYSRLQVQQVFEANGLAGINTLNGSAVPAGKIWLLQQVQAVDLNNAPTSVILIAYSGAVQFFLAQNNAPAAAVHTIWTGAFVMPANWNVQAYFAGVTLNDDLYLRYTAVEIDLE